MSYAVDDARDNELRMDHRLTGYKVSLHSKWAKTNIQTPLFTWTHFCFLYRFLTGEWKIFVNGELSANGTLPRVDVPLEGGGAYIIGQEQDSFGATFQRDQSYSGEITQLNFWSNELSDSAIKQLAWCEAEVEDEALGWSSGEWDLHGEVRMVTRPMRDICHPSTRYFKFFPDRFTLRHALHLCQVVGGTLAVPQTKEENSLVFKSSVKNAAFCSGKVGASYLWLGANDQQTERQWVYWGSGRPLLWESSWRGSGPNGGTVENCLVMLYGEFPARWSDIACLDSYAFCVPCEFERLQTLYLKGPAVCQNSPFNQRYLLGEERNGRPSILGYFHSDIFWNDTEGVWVLQSLKREDAVAWWRPPRPGLYPFGIQRWTLGFSVCNLAEGASVSLTLSMCGVGKFTCADGGCISLAQRCDLRLDCLDHSDEAQCSLVAVPDGYQTTIPPPPTTPNKPLPIYFTIIILSFPTIVTDDLTFTASLQLKLRWMDTRLNYLNLKDDRTLNLLSRESVLSIWTPKVFFTNAHGNVFTNLNQGSRVECIKEGESAVGGPHLTHETNIFSGANNSLEMSQSYAVMYTCDFDLLMFPFDTQNCTMYFMLVSASASYMTLVPSLANYTGNTNLIEYSIGQMSVGRVEGEEFSSVAVQVIFRRRYGFYLLTLYIPTTLLLCIAYATFFFNPDDFNSRIIVALTSLLVLASLYTQTSNSLPKTSYFKLVDVWLFFAIVMIFVVVLLQTLIDFSLQMMLDEKSKMVQAFKTIWGLCSNSRSESGKLAIKVNQVSVEEYKTKTKLDGASCVDVPPSVGGNWVHLANDHSHEEVRARPLYGRAIRRANWADNKDVNMSLMTKSRILIPVLFFIFNGCYWGAAISHVNKMGSGAN
ncbi:uncharacterized protein [Panulirus ornatus]|uniref:uncharacterized protein n=1 Tax=Panulirus ornatus TaxID=150431 RepID=UPI003A8B2B5A